MLKLLRDEKKSFPHLLPDLNSVSHEQAKYLRKQRPMICTPIRGATVMGNYHMSLMAVTKWAERLGVDVDVQMLFGCTYIEHGRNVLANTFWNSNCTHLVFVDADNGFVANHFFELLLCRKDIVGGLYTRRKINWQAVHAAALAGVPAEMLAHCGGDFPVHCLKDQPVRIGQEPQRVLTLPTGFLCISRRALERYVEAHPDRKTTPGNPGHFGIQFFTAGTIKCDDGSVGFDSEDNLFCKDMLRLSVDTWVCPWMQVSHYGEQNFESCFACSNGAYIHLPGWIEKQQAKA